MNYGDHYSSSSYRKRLSPVFGVALVPERWLLGPVLDLIGVQVVGLVPEQQQRRLNIGLLQRVVPAPVLLPRPERRQPRPSPDLGPQQ